MELLNTELDAVNLALASIGREPVATLDSSDLDAGMAKSALDRASIDIQLNRGRGWWFNQEKGWKLSPDNDGYVSIPNNTLSVIQVRSGFYDQGDRLTVRGYRVYDTDNHTYDLRDIVDKGGEIELDLILLLEYRDIPSNARSAIAWRARRVFSDDILGDPNQHSISLNEERSAFASLEMEDRKTRRSNYLLNNSNVNNMLGRIGGYNNLW